MTSYDFLMTLNALLCSTEATTRVQARALGIRSFQIFGHFGSRTFSHNCPSFEIVERLACFENFSTDFRGRPFSERLHQ